jgi:hypothetical protein
VKIENSLLNNIHLNNIMENDADKMFKSVSLIENNILKTLRPIEIIAMVFYSI